MQIISNEKHFGSIQVNIFHDHRKKISENSIAEKFFFLDNRFIPFVY